MIAFHPKAFYLCIAIVIGLPLTGQISGTLLDQWQDQSLPSSSAHDNRYNEVWGFVQNGREYGVIGTTWGTHIIDVTNPKEIEEVAKIQGAATGTQIIHRDYHDYKGYLYAVCDEGATSTLQIIDLSHLPDSVNVVYDSQALIRRAHNIFIDSTSARMYALITAGATLPRAPMRVFDIQDPVNPILIGTFDNIDGIPLNTGVHDAWVENNIAFLNNGYGGVVVADFTDIDSVLALSSLKGGDYPDSGYNHSGWPSKNTDYYYMADENHGYDMKVVNTKDKSSIGVEGVFNCESSSPHSIPHNQVVAGDYLFVAYYFDGLQVYDISIPNSPKRVMHYQTSSRPHIDGKYQGAWGVYPFLPSGNILVSDMQEGLFVIQKFDPTTSNDFLQVGSDVFKMYPNPIYDSRFSLEMEPSNLVNLELYDLNGKLLQKWNRSNENRYEINYDVKNGLYIMVGILENGTRSTNKVMVFSN